MVRRRSEKVLWARRAGDDAVRAGRGQRRARRGKDRLILGSQQERGPGGARVVCARALLSAKVSTPGDVDMVAVGVYCAGAHIVHIDGSYGGTGAAPNIAKKNIAMPIEYAINSCHRFLSDEGVRDEITLIASGGIRTPADVAKAIAMGADGCVIGTAELVALECIRCGCCESGRGCPRGICTTDPELLQDVTIEWCTQRLINMYNAWREMLVDILYRLGLDSVAALRGRTDLLTHLDYENEIK